MSRSSFEVKTARDGSWEYDSWLFGAALVG
jgi:hypothetical protein